ncbi:MAG: hypothetical protein WAL47_12875 [Pyrinomonadaceae bacterium]
MKNHRAPSVVGQLAFATAVALLTFVPQAVRGQQNIPSAPAVKDPFGEIRERQQREAQLRSAEMVGPARKGDTRDFETGAKQMREDFKAIQVMRNNVARHLLSEKPLDYKFIAAESESINKRANRLRAFLITASVEGEKKEENNALELGDNQMKGALVAMCKRIDSFTENPVFKLPDVVDAPQSAKAGSDLRDIILLSDGIVKLAGKLNKPPRN